MLCFQDRTFCTFYRDCAKAVTCSRPLTEIVTAAATKWWGGPDAPIARFAEKPSCHQPLATPTPAAGDGEQGKDAGHE